MTPAERDHQRRRRAGSCRAGRAPALPESSASSGGGARRARRALRLSAGKSSTWMDTSAAPKFPRRRAPALSLTIDTPFASACAMRTAMMALVVAGCGRLLAAGRRRRSRLSVQLERAMAAGDGVSALRARRSADALVDRIDAQGPAPHAHHHQRQVSRGRGAEGAGCSRCAPPRRRTGAVLQARQRRAPRGRGVSASGSARCRGRSRARSTAPTRCGWRGRTACRSTSRRTRTAAGAGASCAATGSSRRIGRSTRSRRCRTTPSCTRRPRRGRGAAVTRAHRVAVIPGDGIGVEVTAEAVKRAARAVAGAAAARSSWSSSTGAPSAGCATAPRCPRARWRICAIITARSCSARSAIRACRSRCTRATSCSGSAFKLDLYINLRPVQAARRAFDAAQE